MSYDLDRFIAILETENRADALTYIADVLAGGDTPFYEIYEHLLGPALNAMQSSGVEDSDIWAEHVRTAIIKTIVENMYLQVTGRASEKPGQGLTVVVFCPPDEYHSVGARMVTDMFTHLGFEAIFVGGNTPLRVLEAGLNSRQVDWVAISVSNPYHLISTRNIIEQLRKAHPRLRILVGGNAVKRFGERASMLNADHVVTTFAELKALVEGGDRETGL